MASLERVLIGGFGWFVALGVVLFLWGLLRAAKVHQIAGGKTKDLKQILCLTQGLRITLMGLCLVGCAMGAMFGKRWLLIAAIVVALEELYETTLVIQILRHFRQREEAEEQAQAPLASPLHPPGTPLFGRTQR